MYWFLEFDYWFFIFYFCFLTLTLFLFLTFWVYVMFFVFCFLFFAWLSFESFLVYLTASRLYGLIDVMIKMSLNMLCYNVLLICSFFMFYAFYVPYVCYVCLLLIFGTMNICASFIFKIDMNNTIWIQSSSETKFEVIWNKNFWYLSICNIFQFVSSYLFRTDNQTLLSNVEILNPSTIWHGSMFTEHIQRWMVKFPFWYEQYHGCHFYFLEFRICGLTFSRFRSTDELSANSANSAPCKILDESTGIQSLICCD